MGFAYLVFKTTCIDRRKPLCEDVFSFAGMVLFSPLDKRNTGDKAKGLCISSEGHVGELGAQCLSTLKRGQDSRQQSLFKVAAIDRVNEGIAQDY